MIYLLEFLKGILIAFGIIAGFVICLIYVTHEIKNKLKKNNEYEADDLIKPFEKYLLKINYEENYEQIKQVEKIIEELKAGTVTDEIYLFKIKKDTSIHLIDENDDTAIRVVPNYTVIKKKEIQTV